MWLNPKPTLVMLRHYASCSLPLSFFHCIHCRPSVLVRGCPLLTDPLPLPLQTSAPPLVAMAAANAPVAMREHGLTAVLPSSTLATSSSLLSPRRLH